MNTQVPLVLHGSSGISYLLRKNIANKTNVAKFNIGTELRMVAGHSLRNNFNNNKKEFVKLSQLDKEIKDTLEDIQNNLFNKAKSFLNSNIVSSTSFNDFLKQIKNKKLVKAFFCGNIKCEELIKDKTQGATSRLIPFQQPRKTGKCIHCNKEGKFLVIFGKAY
mgnify:CR=1 FL=1